MVVVKGVIDRQEQVAEILGAAKAARKGGRLSPRFSLFGLGVVSGCHKVEVTTVVLHKFSPFCCIRRYSYRLEYVRRHNNCGSGGPLELA